MLEAWEYLPNPWRHAISELPTAKRATLEEIRFRVGRPLHLYGTQWNVAVPELVPSVLTFGHMEQLLSALVAHSLYTRVEEMRHGYITLPGGHRVGIAGRAVMHDGVITTMREISGINVRVGKTVIGPGDELLKKLQAEKVLPGSWLIASPPRGGKTTMLRDLVRVIGDHGQRVVVVDERSEVAGFGGTGASGYDLGYHTDVLDHWPKPEGIAVALRTLGPDVIAVDEVGDEEDLQAVRRARFAGVDVIATTHARTWEELMERSRYRQVLSDGTFHALVLLSSTPRAGTIVQVKRMGGVP